MAIYSYRLARGQTRWMFTIDLPPAADGRRRQMNRKGFPRQEDAQAAETAARTSYARSELAADGSLAAELEVWLGERELDVQQTTLGNYQDIVRCYIVPHLGSRQVYALSKRTIHDFYKTLLAAQLAADSAAAGRVLGQRRHPVRAGAAYPRRTARRAVARRPAALSARDMGHRPRASARSGWAALVRVALVHRDLHQITRGGICTLYLALAEHLVRRGHEVVLVTQDTPHPVVRTGITVVTLARTEDHRGSTCRTSTAGRR